MKKVFQIKLKNITKLLAVVIVAGLATLTGCTSYDQDIKDANARIDQVVTDVTSLKTSVAALQTSVNGMTYIKSITMGTDGKLTITPSTGSAIVYDAKNYVTYDIALVNNVLTVNGVNKGTVAIPALTFGADNKLMSGTTVVADLSSWVRTLTLSTDNYLVINGTKSTILIPAATVQSVDVKGITISGNVLTITKNDNSTSTITLPQTALTLTAVSSNNGELTLNLNGVDTKVTIKNTYGIDGGFLTVNGVKTTVAIPAENKTSVVYSKVGDVIQTITITDATGATTTVKVNPSTELLAGLLFVPEWIDGGVNAVEVGYIMDIPTAPAVAVKALFTQQNVNFRFNPTAADVTKTTWSYVNNAARLTVSGASNAPGDATTLFAAPTYTSNNDGSGKFTLKVGTWVEPAAGKTHLFALQADGKDFYSGATTHVVSDYVKVVTTPYTAAIRNKVKSTVAAGVVTPVANYSTTVPAVANVNVYDHTIVKGTEVDLNTLVLATASNLVAEKTFEASNFGTLGTDYKFEYSLPTYTGTDGITNQNSSIFVTLTGNVLKANAAPAPGDRTPLVLVKLKSAAGNLLAQVYIKFKIVETPVVPGGIVPLTVPAVAYNYSQLFVDAVAGVTPGDYKQITVSWDEVNSKIYNPLGLTHNQFQVKYGSVPVTVTATVNGVNDAAASLVKYPLNRSILGPDVDTYAMTYNITPMAKFGTTVLVYTFDTGVATDAKVQITISYTITKPTLDKTILAGYQYPTGNTTNVMTQGMNTGAGYQMQLYLGEAFNYGSAAYRAVFGTGANKIDAATHQFIFQTTTPAQTGAALSVTTPQTSIDAALGSTSATGTLMTLTTPLTTDERVYKMTLQTVYPNSEIDNFDFNVHFVNPFSIVLATGNSFTLTDLVNGSAYDLDLITNYNVLFKGKNIVTKGVAEIANTATAVKASDFIPVPLAANALVYTYANLAGNPYVLLSQPNGAGTSLLRWQNAGTQLTSTVNVGTVALTFNAPFASITKAADNVSVKPE